MTFLRRASVLERLSAPVCDGILQRTGSARLLSDLAGSNMPLFAAEGPDCFRLNAAMARTFCAASCGWPSPSSSASCTGGPRSGSHLGATWTAQRGTRSRHATPS